MIFEVTILDGVLLLIAIVCNSVMDTLAHHHGSSIFRNTHPTSFFGKDSWKRKYKNRDSTTGESAFPMSRNVLVFLTDGWHLCKTIMLLCLFYLISNSIWITLAIYVIWGVIFELFYSILLKRE